MTLVGDDEVEGLDGNIRIVGNRAQFAIFVAPGLKGRALFGGFIQFLTAQHGVKSLNSGDDDLGVRVNAVGMQMLNDIGLIEFPA